MIMDDSVYINNTKDQNSDRSYLLHGDDLLQEPPLGAVRCIDVSLHSHQLLLP